MQREFAVASWTDEAPSRGQWSAAHPRPDHIGLVDIVRRAEQAQLLRDLGAVHVVDSSQPGLPDRLTAAIRDTLPRW